MGFGLELDVSNETFPEGEKAFIKGMVTYIAIYQNGDWMVNKIKVNPKNWAECEYIPIGKYDDVLGFLKEYVEINFNGEKDENSRSIEGDKVK